MATGGEDEYVAQRVLRLTDIPKEPKDFLMPISGYENMPIVSLEEAVEPLVSILPRVKSYVRTAKNKCKQPADNLTQDESASIMLYSMEWKPMNECLYCALNATLRLENRTKLKPWFLFLRLFLGALFRLPPISPKTVYRGVKLDLSEQFKEDETFIWWGFSSCTTSIKVLQSEQFLGMNGARTMFTIHCNSARDIRKHSYFPSEDEVLLLAATEFQVKGILNQGNDLRTIQLQEVHSDEPMLIPVSCTNDSPQEDPQPTLPENKVTTPVLPPPMFGKITEPDDPNKDSKQPLIDGNGGFESENKNNIKQSTYPQTGSCLFHRKSKLILIIIVVLSLITIISITIWVISIKKADTTMNGPKWGKWKQNAITMAGGNGQGQELNQLYGPHGIFIDEKKNIFIADTYNHRIVEWKHNANEAQIIAGGNGKGNRMDQLNEPTDMIVDQQNHSIIIADSLNRRVIQWLNQKQQILIDSINCSRLAMDKHGFLYVSDRKKNEVRRWKMGEYSYEGIIVAGGNGKGNKLNQLNSPGFMFVDEEQSVYVSDKYNHRVMKWNKDAKEGRIVIGGNGQGGNLTQLSYPEGIIIDHLGQIYVSDFGNNRVMRWCKGKEESEIVVGGNGQGNQSNQLIGPGGLSFDNEGNLYVVDHWNFRIQKFVTVL
ncbi:unnamed protein product [Adineta steineri]|uniref:NAD(P)(+)--arginine ADP-ribosyltransferase n=1 Tax=Adineta steineri TaxID=433720 RepID=A0A815SBU4_9BILA|nr:unnamed protein product [Adineta steineri]CAF1488482.1 unnamed protein product [Adineta steineri]